MVEAQALVGRAAVQGADQVFAEHAVLQQLDIGARGLEAGGA